MRDRDPDPPPSGRPDEALPSRSAELLEIVPCALMEVTIDAAGHRAITYFSGPASQMYGYSRADVLGRDPVLLSAAAPDEISRWRASLRRDRPLSPDDQAPHQGLGGSSTSSSTGWPGATRPAGWRAI